MSVINHEDIRDLHGLLHTLKQYLNLIQRIEKVKDFVDMSILSSESVLPGLEEYPIWAMDKKGYCLVGIAADSIEHIDSIRRKHAHR